MISFARPQSDNVETNTVNIALFVDLILVFIIIFIIVVPLGAIVVSDVPSRIIPINLPALTGEQRPQADKPPLYLTLKSDLTLALGNEPVERQLLGGTLDAAAKGDKDTRIFLRADKAVPYGEVMEVMNLLRNAGYLKVALVAQEKAPQTLLRAGDNSDAMSTWKTQIVAAIERNKRFPAEAARRGATGTAQVFFTLDRQGHLISSRILRSSGAAVLDSEALALLQRAEPFPPPPAEYPGDSVNLILPLHFDK
jgi:biopolymer transport protein ExbD